MKYFVRKSYTFDSLRDEYRILCKKLHPDTGGDAEAFKEMSQEYESLKLTIHNTKPYNNSVHRNTKPNTKSDTKSKSCSPEELRFCILYDALISNNRCEDSVLELSISLFKTLARLPFTDASVKYYNIDRMIVVTMEFEKTIEELEISKFIGYDELAYTIFYPNMMYKSAAPLNIILDKVLDIIWEKTNVQKTHYQV